MPLAAVSSQQSSNAVVPLLTISNNTSADDADNRQTFTHNQNAAVTHTTASQLHSADEPVVLPDDLIDPSDNATVVQLATDDAQQPLPDFTVAGFTTETTEAVQAALLLNATESIVTATHEEVVEAEEEDGVREDASRVANITGNLALLNYVKRFILL